MHLNKRKQADLFSRIGGSGGFLAAARSGFLIGADTVGPGSGYAYNGKPWFAIDIGYAFSN